MDQNTKNTAQIDRATYPFRYTIDYHLKVRAARLSIDLGTIKRELLTELDSNGIGMSERMFDRYRLQGRDSDKAELSEIRLEVIGEYFGIKAREVITDNI